MSEPDRFLVPAYFREWAGKDNFDALQRAADTIEDPGSTQRQVAAAARFVLASARFVMNCAAPFDWDGDEEVWDE